jgi:hypothetical protein
MRIGREKKKTSEVFGVSNEVLPDSYVDRGELDEALGKLLERATHIALRGESKSGKSWLRQTVLPDAIVVQCRLGKKTIDIYRDALSELGISLEVETVEGTRLTGRVEAKAELGVKLLAKLGIAAAVEAEEAGTTKTVRVGHDISDLKFIADLILASDRRLVVEDFHYLSVDERRTLAFDLKALWDYGVFVVIVGVWSQQNMLLFLNADLAGRVQEVPIVWTEPDLGKVFERGGEALKLRFSSELQTCAIKDCYENVGILQTLIVGTLDELGIEEEQGDVLNIDRISALEAAAMTYAEQLNPLYIQFASRVARGIRKRTDATGIYAHAMAVVLNEPDEALIQGLGLDRIYEEAHAREGRIQKGNLRTVLEKFEGLQVDDAGRGLVLAYNDATRELSVVDRQLLLYRKYATVTWPWEDLLQEAASTASS